MSLLIFCLLNQSYLFIKIFYWFITHKLHVFNIIFWLCIHYSVLTTKVLVSICHHAGSVHFWGGIVGISSFTIMDSIYFSLKFYLFFTQRAWCTVLRHIQAKDCYVSLENLTLLLLCNALLCPDSSLCLQSLLSLKWT